MTEPTVTTAQIDHILDAIEAAGPQNLAAQLPDAERAAQLAHAIGYARGESRALYLCSSLYTSLGDYVKVASYAQQALTIAQAHDLPLERAYALTLLAGAYSNNGMTLEALEMLQNEAIAASAQQNLYLQEKYLNTLAITHLNTGSYDRAIEAFQKVLELGRTARRGQAEYVALHNIGSVYSMQGKIEQALRYFREAAATAERYEWLSKQISALLGVAAQEIELKRLDDATATLDQVGRLTDQLGMQPGASLLRFRGHLRYEQGAHADGLRDLEQALEQARAQNDWYNLRFILNELSGFYEQQGAPQQALALVRELLDMTQKSNSEQIQSRVQTLHAFHEVDNLRLRSEAAERELIAYKQAEQERLEKERMAMVLHQEQEYARQKQRVLARLHHELRTPLAIINSSAQIIGQYGLRLPPEKLQRQRTAMQEQIARFEKQLANIATVLQAKSELGTNEPVALDLVKLCAAATAQAETETKQVDRIHMTTRCAAPLLALDKDLVTAIITELLINALKFSTATVEFTVACTTDLLEITVTDQGIGIPAPEQAQVFEPLFRASNTDDIGGSGLGLTIVRDYVRHLGGTVQITSEIGQSTVVNVRLPLPKRGSTGPLGGTQSDTPAT
ncbi:MAG: tetratricopeptide repeat protein [Chloroflexi bacterium]|nr:tetratricopeptide repeat protein [Chloroflexota bacterium]